MERCPHCNEELNPQLHLVRTSLSSLSSTLLGWERPSARRARKFTVLCPHCSRTYVSSTVRRLGFITHGNYVLVVGIVCFAAIAVLFLVRPGG
jgi:hypothetical protein